MNKQSISFKADEQKLIKTGGIEHYASNIVAYIEATFDLGTNWNGYDSVRAVWSNDYLTDISTVLDNNGKCIVPTEVLTDTGNVTVNLVGSIADGDTLTDRLTTYPCKAVIVDADAKVEGEETESITPSQFEQFVEIVHDEVEQVTGMTAEAETLPAGSDATASYSDGVLSFGIPKGDKGEQGEQGETGHTGEPAGFGDVTASVDNTVGTPSVNVTASGPDTAKEFDFEFHNLKGEQGDTGETGETGNGIASTVLNSDYTLTITFTDGTSYTTPSIRGAKGDTGDTGATGNGIQSTVLNADYTLTITFTDGTSYTTPSIRGEQGPAGPVSDVTVNGTSVVDQNGVAVIKMPELVKTVQGNPIVLDDAFGEVKKLDVELLPIQDLHGYDKPWAAGAGKNIYDQSVRRMPISLTAGTTLYCKHNDTASFYLYGLDEDEQSVTLADMPPNSMVTVTLNTNITLLAISQTALDSLTAHNATLMVSKSTITTIEPYSNICPITGHDSVTVTDTDGDSQSQSKTVTLPHTVYGAGVGVTSGSGKEKVAYLDLATLASSPSWNKLSSGTGAFYMARALAFNPAIQYPLGADYPISDTYAYSASGTQTNGTMRVSDALYIVDDRFSTISDFRTYLANEHPTICYKLATPTDLTTTPTSVELFSGDNVISSDGDMELSYVQDMAMVIRKIENQL